MVLPAATPLSFKTILMISEEDFYLLKSMQERAEQQEAKMDKLEASLTAYCNKLLSEIYGDEMMTLESEGFKLLNTKTWRMVRGYSGEVNKIICKNQVKE